MADTTEVRLSGVSSEDAALRLFQMVLNVEKKTTSNNPADGYATADRNYVLKTFAACMQAVKSPSYYL